MLLQKSTPALAAFLGCLGLLDARAESYHPAVENSLRQFPAGSTDLIPPVASAISETLRVEMNGPVTIDKITTIEFESFEPVLSHPGIFQPAPVNLELEQIPKFNRTTRLFEFELKLGNSTFSSVQELKDAIARLPKGSRITWAPSCFRVGGEPLSAAWTDFKPHCEKLGIILIIVPSG